MPWGILGNIIRLLLLMVQKVEYIGLKIALHTLGGQGLPDSLVKPVPGEDQLHLGQPTQPE